MDCNASNDSDSDFRLDYIESICLVKWQGLVMLS